MQASLLGLGFLASLTLGLSDPSAAPEPLRISGGIESKECAWPPVHFMAVHPLANPQSEGACTATLIHPRVVLFAAHCGSPIRLFFKNRMTNPKGRVIKEDAIEKSFVNKSFKVASDVHVDWAVAVLKEPVTDTPIIPMATGCELAMLQKTGSPVVMAGGSPNNGKAAESYVIRWGNTKISSANGSVIHIGAGDPTACTGDSGGPLLAQLPDKSWRTIGITSTMTGSCGSPMASNNYAQINADLIRWVIKKSGINVSPCHSPDGDPTPSKACDTFMAYAGDPSNPQGDYKKFCAGAKVEPVRNACGVPKSEDVDEGNDGSDGDESSSSGNGGTSTTETDKDSTEKETAGSSESSPDDTDQDENQEPSDDASNTEDSEEQNDEESSDSSEEDDADVPEDTSNPKPSPKRGCISAESGFRTQTFAGLLMLLVGLSRKRNDLRPPNK